MYHIHSGLGGWYETIMRSFIVLHRLWDDLGTDFARLLLPACIGYIFYDHGIYIVLLQIICMKIKKGHLSISMIADAFIFSLFLYWRY